eukprot:3298787-Rhodomonas_salina.1
MSHWARWDVQADSSARSNVAELAGPSPHSSTQDRSCVLWGLSSLPGASAWAVACWTAATRVLGGSIVKQCCMKLWG